MKIRILLFFVLLFVISGCCHRPVEKSVSRLPEKADKKKDKASDEILIKGIIDPSLYLENRVANCDSAFAYMQNVISPGYARGFSSWVNIKIRGESADFLNKEKRVGSRLIYPNVRFYLSPQCLVGRDIRSVMDIFLEKKYHDQVLKELNEFQEKYKNEVSIFVSGLYEFSLKYTHGYIVSANFFSTTSPVCPIYKPRYMDTLR